MWDIPVTSTAFVDTNESLVNSIIFPSEDGEKQCILFQVYNLDLDLGTRTAQPENSALPAICHPQNIWGTQYSREQG